MNAAIADNITETDLVRSQTRREALRRIDDRIEERIRFYASQPKEVLDRRIADLDREWDIERWLETSASSLALSGLLLGLTANRKWLLLTGTAMGFLLMHAIQGWCPPVPLLRRMGVRTRGEIDREKFALKVLRGDLQGLPTDLDQLRRNPVSQVLKGVSE